MAIKLQLLFINSADIDRAVRFYEAMGLHCHLHSHGSGLPHYASENPGCVFEIYSLEVVGFSRKV